MSRDEAVAEVRRRLTASPARVFAAFADASLVSRWLTPSQDVGLDVLQLDFRVGDSYRFAYHVPGREPRLVNGLYRVIEPASRIVFSWNIEPPDEHAGLRSEATVTLTPNGTATDLLIRHAQLTAPGACDRHAAGWSGALDHLAVMFSGTDDSTSLIGERGTACRYWRIWCRHSRSDSSGI
jgi:uncharacterized protein YndB with AHSA1/START domain